jgi:transcriptional regulator NrdR family protein
MDKRPSKNDLLRRRRECQSCGQRFTTYELVVVGRPQVETGRIVLNVK